MKPCSVMLIAGEPSGDLLGAEIVPPLSRLLTPKPGHPVPPYQPLQASLGPRFFGAGGQHMAEAGVQVELDMTAHSVVGLSEAVRKVFRFRALLKQLLQLACHRQPDLIICIDFSGFNRRFVHAVRKQTPSRTWFSNWQPKIVQYVSPQVWASRPGRAEKLARDYDLLLSIIPFENEWYAKRLERAGRRPGFRIEYVGHPVVDRYAGTARQPKTAKVHSPPNVLLLPGSRESELRRHLPVMIGALAMMRANIPDLRARMVLPSDTLLRQAKGYTLPSSLELQCGSLAGALAKADVAIASTGTVTMECAYFGVPTVALYRTSWSTYEIGRRMVSVRHLAMPNLLARKELFPEFIQHGATPDNLAGAALELLRDEPRREKIMSDLDRIIASLGPPGASQRAAEAIAACVRGSD